MRNPLLPRLSRATAAAGRAAATAVAVAVAVAVAGCGAAAPGGEAPGAPSRPEAEGGAAGETGAEVPPGAQAVRVDRVVDGDTLVVVADGPGPLPPAPSRVRLLEVDAPESVAPDRPVECHGPEAGDALRELVPPGSLLFLEVDVEPVDRFDRALRYAWTSQGVLVNEALVRAGHAEAVLIGGNDRHIDRLRAAEREARAEGAGLWGACR